MALLGMESWDIYGTGDITDYFVSVGPGSIVGGAGRCGSAAWLGIAAAGSGPSAGITTSQIAGYAAMAYSPTGTNQTNNLRFGSIGSGAASVWAFINVEDNGSISLWRGVNRILGTRITSTAAGLVTLGHYTHIGAEAKQGASGYLRVYVNGHLAADTGTVNMISAFTDGLPFGRIDFNPIGYIDDLYWGDVDASDPLNPWTSISQLGDQHVEGQLCLTDAAGGGGTFREWTPSAGTDHGALLDENPPDDGTTYVTSGTVGQRESVKFPAIIPTTGSVSAIQVMPNAVKTTFADRLAAAGLLEGGTTTLGADQAIAQTNYRYYPKLIAYNPRTAAIFTIAQANAAEALFKITG